jgi:L-alanine-DL-glutamate epimerase-like enolase superfamily enzyme
MRTLQMAPLNIPFKQSFKHASAERHVTQSVWVQAGSTARLRGYGEGCPREYVTGETIDSALTFFRSIHDAVSAIDGLDELRAWVVSHSAEIDVHPAAWCAIELALLDVMARERAQSVEAMLSLPVIAGPFRYTAVLGAEKLEIFQQQLARYLQMGFRDFKVKLSGDVAADQARLSAVRAMGAAIGSLRLDANNLWSNSVRARDFLSPLEHAAFAIEEPLSVGDFAGLREIAAATQLRIILDESFLRLGQFEAIAADPSLWIINLRISKMGGLLRSLAIADEAARLGIPLVIGCQVGETSLLTRAALTVVQSIKDGHILGQEGAFGTHLLAKDVVEPPLMFGAGGLLDVTPYRFDDAFGFGLNPIAV